jgi:hypothetical protein
MSPAATRRLISVHPSTMPLRCRADGDRGVRRRINDVDHGDGDGVLNHDAQNTDRRHPAT